MTLKNYVESGKCDQDTEQGFKYLDWFCWAVIVVAFRWIAWILAVMP